MSDSPRVTKNSIENTTDKPEARHAKKKKKTKKKQMKMHMKKQKRKGKGKKCIFKILKKDKRNRRKGGNKLGLKKKFLMPMMLGLFAAKSVLIPIALKALALMSAKGKR